MAEKKRRKLIIAGRETTTPGTVAPVYCPKCSSTMVTLKAVEEGVLFECHSCGETFVVKPGEQLQNAFKRKYHEKGIEIA